MRDHAEHLALVLRALATNKFVANLKKCQFAAQQIEYLGHLVSATGVAADPSKLEVMKAWPTPTNIKQLWG